MKSHVRSEWQGAILVCRKCGKKAGGGFGPKGKTSLAKALRKEMHGGKGRKAKLGVVEVGCLDICPKRAVTVVDTRHPGEWLIVRAGTPVEDVVGRLNRSADETGGEGQP
ncbi:hypothetical protein SAMN06295912_105212 [Sphingomonas laterariae]|uniref:(2Fe-2S) ferredoxin n=1 Tax=Edaphosphingomonas laterariae TaxID=861865 RepID=A0A239E5D3_9SPHN|nr:hypothetical protein [Sphingomonas laterariae]SNS39659.1 hypothetical protein SAMN06295912_105212 [Sphingomonas laterariae]